MKPDRPGTTRLFALVFAAWTAVGVLSFTTVALHFVVTERSAADGPLNLLHLLGCITANVWLWAILTLPIMAAADRWPVLGAHRRLRHVGVHVVLLMAVSVLGGVEGTAVDLLITGRSDGALSNMLRMAPFDVLAYVRFTLAPMSRGSRVRAAISTGLGGYEREMRAFLEFVLGNYERNGIGELGNHRIGDFLRIRYGGVNDAKRALGSVEDIRSAFVKIQRHLFA